MAYHQLSLPAGLPVDLENLVRKQLEPQLIDAHAMLRLPIAGDPGLQGGCNLAVAQVLLSLISGSSVTLYDPGALTRRGDRTRLFKQILVDYYPWDQERHIAGAQIDADAAGKLYRLFRNPLAHTLGVIDPQDNPTGQRIVVEKGSFAEEVIDSDERSTARPTDWVHPTLRQEGTDLTLWVRSFYWGVRSMIENVAAARARSKVSAPISSPLSNVTWRTT